MDRPKRMGVMHSRRIKLRHYQFRSLEQIKQRVTVRAEAKRNGFPGFDYSIDENVDSYLYDRKSLYYYRGDDSIRIDGPHNHLFQRWYDVVLKTVFHKIGVYK